MFRLRRRPGRARALPGRRAARALGVVGLALAATVAGGPANATAIENPSPSAGLAWNWDGGTVSLDWRGHQSATATGSFVGTPISVPGDYAHGRIILRNNGPATAKATVEIIDAVTMSPAGSSNTNLEDLIQLRWSVGEVTGARMFADVATADTTTIATTRVARGGTIPVTIGYRYPIDATTGKSAGNPSTRLTFRVRITLVARHATPSPYGPTSPAPTHRPAPRPLPITGAEIAAIAGLALVVLVAGGLLAASRRRQRT